MPGDSEYDPKVWEDIRERSLQLKSDYSKWETDAKDYENVYLVESEEVLIKKATEDTKLTISPDAAISLIGAQRLLSATDPRFNVSYDKANPKQKAESSNLERFCRTSWNAAGRVYGAPLHLDVSLSGLMFADVHITCALTSDLVEDAKELPSEFPRRESLIRRAEAVAEQTPVLWDIINPREGKAEYDRFGLSGYLRVYEATKQELLAEWGDAVAEELKGRSVGTRWKVEEWFDADRRCLSIGRTDPKSQRPFFIKEHGLGVVPVVANIIEGTRLFSKPEQMRRPFLYTLLKSGIWNRQNLALTVLYTAVFSIASLAMWKHRKGVSGKDLNIDLSRTTLGIAELEQGEDLEPMMAKGAIDPALMQALELAQRLGQESTIHRQALGEPLGANAPYSMVALLHQAGRLPLVTPQKLCGWAISDAMQLAFRMMKAKGGTFAASWLGQEAKLAASKLPKNLPLEVVLDIDLPQDWERMAQTALNMINAELASRRFVREKMLNIPSSEEMDDEIWEEGAANAYFKATLERQVMEELTPETPEPPEVPPEGLGGETGAPTGVEGEPMAPGGSGAPGPAVGGTAVGGGPARGALRPPMKPRGM